MASGRLAYPYSTRELVNLVRHVQAFPSEAIHTVTENVIAFDKHNTAALSIVRDIFSRHGVPIISAISPEARGLAKPVSLPGANLLFTWSPLGPGATSDMVRHNLKVKKYPVENAEQVTLAQHAATSLRIAPKAHDEYGAGEGSECAPCVEFAGQDARHRERAADVFQRAGRNMERAREDGQSHVSCRARRRKRSHTCVNQPKHAIAPLAHVHTVSDSISPAVVSPLALHSYFGPDYSTYKRIDLSDYLSIFNEFSSGVLFTALPTLNKVAILSVTAGICLVVDPVKDTLELCHSPELRKQGDAGGWGALFGSGRGKQAPRVACKAVSSGAALLVYSQGGENLLMIDLANTWAFPNLSTKPSGKPAAVLQMIVFDGFLVLLLLTRAICAGRWGS